MLQQTRAAAVVPYYERFLALFPDPRALATAELPAVLAAWAGLGYYSRARLLHRAARALDGAFPSRYEDIRAMPGVGDYTAAAVASIAFELPHAAVDGNVLRVLSRLANDPSDIASPKTRGNFQAMADSLLHPEKPGAFNQAMMELGATICVPKGPRCLLCPVRKFCAAASAGTQNELPVKQRKARSVAIERTLLLVRKGNRFLFWQRPVEDRKLGGFWELPELSDLPDAEVSTPVGSFRHSIMNHDYRITVCPAKVNLSGRKGYRWIERNALETLPVSTTARKALRWAG